MIQEGRGIKKIPRDHFNNKFTIIEPHYFLITFSLIILNQSEQFITPQPHHLSHSSPISHMLKVKILGLIHGKTILWNRPDIL